MAKATDAAAPGSSLWRRTDGSLRLVWRLTLAWLAFVAALSLVSLLGDAMHEAAGIARKWVNSVVVAGIVVPAIYLLRRHGDRKTMAGMGLSPRLSQIAWLPAAMLGIILLAVGVLALCVALEWVTIVEINTGADAVPFLLGMLAYIFFFESLPEEMVFRGYLFTNLNTVLPRWLALLAQVSLFALAPIAAVSVVSGLFGLETMVGGANHVTFEYVLVLVIFGCTLQLCRIVTGSLWASIGFHLGFISLSRFVGPHKSALVRVEDVVPRTLQEVVIFLGALVVPALLLLLVSVLRGRKSGWGRRAPEADGA